MSLGVLFRGLNAGEGGQEQMEKEDGVIVVSEKASVVELLLSKFRSFVRSFVHLSVFLHIHLQLVILS